MKILKFLLKSLFSNAEVANNGKKQKWWLTFVVLILALGLAILPNIITVSNTNGSQYITTYSTYHVDYSLKRLSTEYLAGSDSKLNFTINSNGELIEGEKKISSLDNAKTVKVNSKDVSYFTIGQKDTTTMVVSYIESHDDFTALEKAIAVNESESTTNQDNVTTYVAHSYNALLLSKKQMKLTIYANNTTVTMSDATTLSNELAPISSFAGVFTDLSNQYKDLSNLYSNTSADLTLENWKNFFTEAYRPLKASQLLYSSILYVALNAMVIIVMSFTTFIMSRFKTALCDKLSFAQALQSIIFLSLCPGLLSFIIYYIIPGLQTMAFFTFLAIRSIFYTTKLTRGEFKAAEKQGK